MSDKKEYIESIEKAREEVAVKNITACVAHSNQTRVLVRTLEKQINELKGMISQQAGEITILNTRITNILTKVYSGGSTEKGD